MKKQVPLASPIPAPHFSLPLPLPHLALLVNDVPYAGTCAYAEQDGQLLGVFEPPLAAPASIGLQLRSRTPARPDFPPAP